MAWGETAAFLLGGGAGAALRAAEHYRARLRSVGSDPALAGAPALAQAVAAAAGRAAPGAAELPALLRAFLLDPAAGAGALRASEGALASALASYRDSLQRALEGSEYHAGTVDAARAGEDLAALRAAPPGALPPNG